MADISGINSGSPLSFLTNSVQNPSQTQDNSNSTASVGQTLSASENAFELSQLLSNAMALSVINPSDATSAESQILSFENLKTVDQANVAIDQSQLAQSLLSSSESSLESLAASINLAQETGSSSSNTIDTSASTSSLPATSAAAQAYLETAELPQLLGSLLNQKV
jgi:hypothetical protein